MLGFVPGASQLRIQMGAGRKHQQSIGRQEVEQRPALAFLIVVGGRVALNWKDDRQVGVARGPLRLDVEVSQRHQLVTPQLRANRVSHPEAVDVQNAAAHAELRHVVNDGNTVEAEAFEPLD